ncbi:MAG: adenosine kinase [Acidimicrobiales bacterium]
MTAPSFDVLGFGNAIVDVLAPADDSLIDRFGLAKGSMRLCDEDEAATLYESMGPAREISGGAAANTIVGVASFGGRAAFVGKVRDDQLGAVFAHDIRAAGVAFDSAAAITGPPTGRCLVLITPDAQRTMSTFLGIAGLLGPDDVPDDLVASAAVTYLEGFLWEQPAAKAAIKRAAKVAHSAGRKVAFTLSDSFCVERNRDEFLALIESSVDVLFANEAEAMSLFGTDDVDAAVSSLGSLVEMAALTRGPAGSVLVAGDRVEVVAASPVGDVVDTTGAGDLYAAGVLFGLAGGHDLAMAGRLGSAAAAEVISHVGARPEASLSDIAAAVIGAQSGTVGL